MSDIWRRYQAVIMTRDFAITAATGVLILLRFIISLFTVNQIIPNIIALVAVTIGGLTIAISAVKGLIHREVNVDELVTIAIIASVIYGEYLSAAFVAFMMLFGKILEDFTAERAKHAIEDLGKLAPETAHVERNGQIVDIPVGDVRPGETVIVKPGERIPVDGEVIFGQASVNQAPITGESMPVTKTRGSEVFAGTLNELGALEVKTTKTGETTVLGRIRQLVEAAETDRAPIVRTADRYARYFTPFILAVAAIVYLITRDALHALTVLIVACPCALVVATPTAIIAGIANGARRGILIKGGKRLEAAGKIDAVAFDKTGTITLGEPQVMRIVPFRNATENEVIGTAAAAERLSEHPLAKAVTAQARESGLKIDDSSSFSVIPGKGVIAECNGKKLTAGTPDLLREHKIGVPDIATATANQLESDGLTVLYIAADGEVIGLIGVADVVRDEVRETVKQLEKSGVKRVVMLTGDNEAVAKRIAESVGIGEWASRLLPDQKVAYIKKMQTEGLKVAMVGDGVNDAPALATSDLGIAMGVTGTDIAMDTADIVLLTGDALKAAEAIMLSRRTLKLIKENLAFALVFNLIGIAAAATGVLSPIGAALFHNIGSVAVVVNSARLAGTKSR